MAPTAQTDSSPGRLTGGRHHFAFARLHSPSHAFGLLGVLIGCSLIALATWFGSALRADLPHAQQAARTNPLQVADTARALVFSANPATGDVSVLNVRGGVSELARLHERRRREVTAVSLDAQRKILTVESSDARYQYDTQTFRLLARNPVQAAKRTHDLNM